MARPKCGFHGYLGRNNQENMANDGDFIRFNQEEWEISWNFATKNDD